MDGQLTETQKKLLFWASFLALAAAGFGFAYRVNVMGQWGQQFALSEQQMGQVFGASLWPIAVTMILFSLIVDRVGYKLSMYFAFALQTASVIATYYADSYMTLYVGGLCAGLGHGIVEAVINPVCASIYNRDKSRMLNILHAAWPAGLVGGGLMVLAFADSRIVPIASWDIHALWMLIPVLAYGLMFLPCKFPIDERVAANVPYRDMLREVGFLGAFLPSMLLFYEIYRVSSGSEPQWLVYASIGVGLVVGSAFGAYTKAMGKPLFAFLCLLMIPLATTELGTDAWIKELMKPVLQNSFSVDAGYALVFSAFIMMFLRFFAGALTSRFNPPTILAISSFFSMCGLLMLSGVSGLVIILAFVVYAVGQTFYWPTVLGFVSERYPRGGALTLNTVSAIGLLSVGIIGTPIMGAFYGNQLSSEVASLSEHAQKEARFRETFFGVGYENVNKDRARAVIVSEAATKSVESAPKVAAAPGDAIERAVAQNLAVHIATASTLAAGNIEPMAAAIASADGDAKDKESALDKAMSSAITDRLKTATDQILVLSSAVSDPKGAAERVKDSLAKLEGTSRDEDVNSRISKALEAVDKATDRQIALAHALNTDSTLSTAIVDTEIVALANVIAAANEKSARVEKLEADLAAKEAKREKKPDELLAAAAETDAKATLEQVVSRAQPSAVVAGLASANPNAMITSVNSQVHTASSDVDAAYDNAAKGALRTTALTFPLAMLIAYALIAFHFRRKGGYEQIHLDEIPEEPDAAVM